MPLAILVALSVGAAMFFSRYRIAGWKNLDIEPRDAADTDESDRPPVQRDGDTVRIATFNVRDLDEAKLSSMTVSRVLVEVVRQFDVVAVQGVRAGSRDVLRQLVEKVNAEGRKYDAILPPLIQGGAGGHHLAFVYDAASVEYDDRSVQSIQDPAKRLSQDPLVALFRVRGPEPSRAFTFALINVQADADRAMVELDVLADVFQAVRQHAWEGGLAEDDVILLGTLNADDRHLGRLGEVPQLTPVTRSARTVTSTVQANRLADNLLFRPPDTVEFTGRWGVVDLVGEFDLSPQEVLEVSDRLPMWAEFSIFEGGPQGPLATRPLPNTATR